MYTYIFIVSASIGSISPNSKRVGSCPLCAEYCTNNVCGYEKSTRINTRNIIHNIMRLTKESALAIIQSRTLITGPGKYSVKVTSVTPYVKGDTVAIINVSAMNSFQANAAAEQFKAGDYDGAANNNLSSSARANDYIPSKGEFVNIQVEEVDTKSGDKALLIVSMTEQKAASAGKVNFLSLIGEEAPAEEAVATSSDDLN